MAIVLENTVLFDIDPIRVERGAIRIERAKIVERGESVKTVSGDEIIDCRGAVVLPGLVNGHTHLYSALAAGMPQPSKTPTNFHEILKYVWWRLDRALDAESIEMSGRIGALDALHCGTTTLIDHHASPECIAGSLDLIEQGVCGTGLRVVQCYETTDRNGLAGRDAGLRENRRYIQKCQAEKSARIGALVGAHASFTCGDETMAMLGALSKELGTGIHIHVAEDPCDEAFCRKDHGISLIDRLEKFGMLNGGCIYGHGTHLDQQAIDRVNAAGVSLGHNTRSNMNNAVGYAPIGKFACPVQLGTDGIGADMFEEARTAWFKSCDGGAGISPADVIGMLANSARRASAALGTTVGKLEVDAAADVVVTDYIPATPLSSANAAGHFLFALAARHVRDVLANGEWALRDRRVTTCDEAAIRDQSRGVTRRLWERLEAIPC